MGAKRSFIRKGVLVAFGLVCLFSLTVPLWAAYQVRRPTTGGWINQWYSYGDIDPVYGVHLGSDFECGNGTPVYAVAGGTVTDFKQDCPDNVHYPDPLCPRIAGNYVIIRHDRQSWDRSRNANSDVYSLSCHLQFGSVPPGIGIGTHVNEGDLIAASDNTGNASGPHLHLRISLSSSSDSTSRNPELWLRPYNDTTGTVVGKLTDSSGNPIGNSTRIYGLSKQPSPPHNYLWSTTYSDPLLHPDDILVENWGTTDASPGTYYPGTGASNLRACDRYGSNCVPYGDLPSYTVVAGEVTYINLYPLSLPDVPASSTFNSYIALHNNSSSETDQGNMTYFDSSATGEGQRQDFIVRLGTIMFSPPGEWTGSGVVVNSERSALVNIPQSYNQVNAYAGVPVQSDPGLAQAKTLYMPNFLNGYLTSWHSKLFVQNAGRAPTTITVAYYGKDGDPACTQILTLNPWERREVNPTDYPCSPPPFGSVHLSADQPLAATTMQYFTAQPRSSTYNAYSEGGSTLYAPILERDFYPHWNSGIYVHNLESSSTHVKVRYYRYTGDYICTDPDPNLYPAGLLVPERGTRMVYQGSSTSCLASYSWKLFSARLETYPLARIIAVVNQEEVDGNDHQAYNAFIRGKKSLVIPWISTKPSWTANIVIQNTSGSSTYANAYYYNLDGTERASYTSQIAGNGAWRLYPTTYMPADFEGSVLITCSEPCSEQQLVAVANIARSDVSDGTASYGAVEK